MPPEVTSDADLVTESEIEFKPVDGDESDYFSSDFREFQKKFSAKETDESDLNSQRFSPRPRRVRQRKYDCDQCSENFRRKTQYDRHMFKHNGIVSNLESTP